MKKALRLARYWLPALLAVVLVVWFVGGSRTFQMCVDRHNQTQPQDKNGSSPQGIYRLIDGYTVNERCAAVFIVKENAAITAISTLFLTLITGGLVFVGWEQAKITRDMHQSRRAFVFVQQVLFFWEPNEKGSIFAFRPQWANSGETHTVGMTTHVNAFFEDHRLPENFSFTTPDEVLGHAMIGPKSSITGGSQRSTQPATFSVPSGSMCILDS